ncbi:MAG: hypothetical protein K2Q12_07040 [Rickettsiales bacterium]|nr:hypothetical protein [Rickettsiales bacterium]
MDHRLMIGFYNVDGDPCRVIGDEAAPQGIRAERYVSGLGFRDMNLTSIFTRGEEVSFQRFKQLVTEEIQLGAPLKKTGTR